MKTSNTFWIIKLK